MTTMNINTKRILQIWKRSKGFRFLISFFFLFFVSLRNNFVEGQGDQTTYNYTSLNHQLANYFLSEDMSGFVLTCFLIAVAFLASLSPFWRVFIRTAKTHRKGTQNRRYADPGGYVGTHVGSALAWPVRTVWARHVLNISRCYVLLKHSFQVLKYLVAETFRSFSKKFLPAYCSAITGRLPLIYGSRALAFSVFRFL